MKIVLVIILLIIVIVATTRPVRYRVTVVLPEPPAPPPSPVPDDEPLCVSRAYLDGLAAETRATLFRVISRDHFRLIEQAIQQRKPGRARELIASLQRQFPEATLEGLEVAEAMIRKLEGKA